MKNFDADTLNLFANLASAKLGKSASDIKNDIDQNKASKLLENLSEKDAEKIKNIMSNPEMMKKIMSSEKAQKILNSFMNQKKQ